MFRFLDKTGRTGTTLQLVNGALLLSTFFFVRIVYGWYTVRLRPFSVGPFLNNIFQSIFFWRAMFTSIHDMPMLYWIVFMIGHTVLMTLNLIWYVLPSPTCDRLID